MRGCALVVTWSSGFVGAQLGSRADAAPVTLLGWRFTLLTVALVLVAVVRQIPWPSWREWGARKCCVPLPSRLPDLYLEGVSRGVAEAPLPDRGLAAPTRGHGRRSVPRVNDRRP